MTYAAGIQDSDAQPARGTLWAVSAGHGIADAYTAFLPVLLPLLAARFGLGAATLALLVTVFAMTSSFPSPVFGRLADRFGHGRVAALSIAVSALTLSLLPTVPNVGLLVAIVGVAGLGSTALHPSGSTLARTGAENAGKAVAIFSAGGMIGYAIGPIAVFATISAFGSDGVIWLALPGLAAAAVLFVMLAPMDAQRSRRPVKHPASRSGLLSPKLAALTLAGAFAFLPFVAAVNGLPIWLTMREGLAPDDRWIAWTITIFSLSGAAGGVLLGILARRIPKRMLLVSAFLGSAAALQSVLLVDPSTLSYVMLLVLGGALTYAATPMLVVMVQDLAPDAPAAAAGMVFGVSAGLAALLYLGVGLLMEAYGIVAALRLAFFAPVVAALIVVFALRDVPARAGDKAASTLEALCGCVSLGALNSPSEARCAIRNNGASTHA